MMLSFLSFFLSLINKPKMEQGQLELAQQQENEGQGVQLMDVDGDEDTVQIQTSDSLASTGPDHENDDHGRKTKLASAMARILSKTGTASSSNGPSKIDLVITDYLYSHGSHLTYRYVLPFYILCISICLCIHN